MGSTTVYRLVSRYRPPAPAAPVDTVLAVHGEHGLALANFTHIVRTAGDSYGPWSQHQLVLLPEKVRW